MKKTLTFLLSLALLSSAAFCGNTATAAAAGGGYSENDLKAESSAIAGEINVRAVGSGDISAADKWQVTYSASVIGGGVVSSPTKIELKIIKNAGEDKFGDDYAIYADFSSETQLMGKSVEKTLTITRESFCDESGTTYVGAFTFALFSYEAAGKKLVATEKLNVEPKPSEYKKRNDFSNVVGSNYVNSKSVSPLHMWMEFNEEDIGKDLYYARALGLNTLRVFLHDLAYRKDPEQFLKNVETFLQIADENGFKTLFVFFDDCHSTDKENCLDFTPEFKSAAKWANSPFPEDRVAENYPAFSGYVKDVITAHRTDERVFGWDIWNEPWWAIIPDSKWKNETIDLHKNAFNWARECSPVQPVMGVYIGKKYSDCDERHTYGEIGTASHVPEYDTEEITNNTLYTEAGNRVWSTSNNSCGSPMEYIHWLKERRGSGKGTPGVFLAWELVNSLTMMNVCNPPNIGLSEAPTVSAGMIYPDGTPCFLSEVAAIREYTKGEKLYECLDDFEDMDISDWEILSGDWEVIHHDWRATDPWKFHRIKDLSTQVPTGTAMLYRDVNAPDIFVEATVKINNFNAQGAGFILRSDKLGNGYYVGFNLSELFIVKQQAGTAEKVASISLEDSNVWTGWHNLLRVSARGNRIEVFLNPYSSNAKIGDVTVPSTSSARVPKLVYTDAENTFSSGGVALKTENTWAQFDDFVVMDYSVAVSEVFGRRYKTDVPAENNTALIVGLVVGGAAILAGAATLCVVLIKRKNRKVKKA